MTDVVVTVPKWFWPDWIVEGDAAGEPETGEVWHFRLYGTPPKIEVGERVYVVAHGKLRGYAPLTGIWKDPDDRRRFALERKGGAVAVTLPCCPGDPCGDPLPIRGFRGWRYRWWPYEAETPFPDWRTP
jgi:hypothetical protein